MKICQICDNELPSHKKKYCSSYCADKARSFYNKNYKKEYYKSNRDKLVEDRKEYYRNNTSATLYTNKKWRAENKDSIRNSKLMSKYGISIEDYNDMLHEQRGLCKICRTEGRSKRIRNLNVDHCHTTGKVRGLLCDTCNKALGLLDDKEELLLRAVKYLKGDLD